MGIVGNPVDARTISNAVEEFRKSDDYFYDMEGATPEGWTYLGDGMYRAAFCSPDGVCYKVEKNPGRGYGQTNFEEYENVVSLVTSVVMPEGTRLPSYTFYKTGERAGYGGRAIPIGVSAMECVNGYTLTDLEDEEDLDISEDEFGYDYDDNMDAMNKIRRACRLSDIHRGNVMRDRKTGEYVLVDLGA